MAFKLSTMNLISLARSIRSEKEQQRFKLAQQDLNARKYRLSLRKQARVEFNDQVDMVKFTMGQLTDSYYKAKDPSLRNQIRNTMAGMHGALPEGIRTAIEPLIKHSPISPEEQRLRDFTQREPMPRPPSREQKIDLSTDPASWEVTPQEWATYEFELSDWKSKKDNVVYGRDITDRVDFVSIAGNAAFRDKSGRVSLYSDQELEIKDLAKELDTTPAALKINNYYHKTDQGFQQIEDGRIITYEVDRDLLEAPDRSPLRRRVVNIEKSPFVKDPAPYPKELTKFMQEFSSRGKIKTGKGSFREVPFVKQVYDSLKEELKDPKRKGSTEALLRTVFPEYSFQISPVNLSKPLLYDNGIFSSSLFGINLKDNFKLIPIRGVPKAFGKARGGETKVYFVDENDLVYDKNNVLLGTVKDVWQGQGADE